YSSVSVPPATSLLMNVTTAYTKDTMTVAHPSRCPHALVRRPPTSRTTAPSAGKKISSHDAAITMSPLPVGRRCPLPAPPHMPRSIHSLVLQQVGVVDRSRPASAENRHDDRQPHDDLRRSHHHDEEGHDLTINGTVHPRESDQRQVHGVQQQLDAHEHHDRVAPYQHTNSTDREQQRGQQQIVRGCHWSRSPSSPGSSATDPDRSPIS